ncbi:MAG: hypothetical protein PUD51_07370 [Prevotellaceae bacterium]|nr:hypothetical protein [Prevotellaceae bacterium]
MRMLWKYYIWLRRCRHSRGFGIQSPTDYAFVRYVINEHWPYYAYSELKSQLPNVSSALRKNAELYFRIANWLQPDITLLITEHYSLYEKYVRRGCRKTNVFNTADSLAGHDSPGLFIFGNNADFELVSRVIADCDVSSVLVVEDIYSSNKLLWHDIASDEHVTISYDLYYLGIAMFDKTRYKTNYKINF